LEPKIAIDTVENPDEKPWKALKLHKTPMTNPWLVKLSRFNMWDVGLEIKDQRFDPLKHQKTADWTLVVLSLKNQIGGPI